MRGSDRIALGTLLGCIVWGPLVACSSDDRHVGDAGIVASCGGAAESDAATASGGSAPTGGTSAGGEAGTKMDASMDSGGGRSNSGGTATGGDPAGSGGTSNGTADAAASGGAGTGGVTAVLSALDRCAKPGDAGVPATDGGAAPCTVLAFDATPYGLVVDGAYVYWTSYVANGRVARVPSGGGAVETLAAAEPWPSSLAVAGGNAVWAAGAPPSKVVTIPLAGGTRREIGAAEWGPIIGVATNGTNAYYATNFNVLESVPLAGGAAIKISEGPYDTNIVDLLLRGEQLYFTNDGAFLPDHTRKRPKSAAVNKVSISATPGASAVVKGLEFPQFFLFVDDTYVFWNNDAFVYRATLLGENVTELAPLTSSSRYFPPITDLVSDGAYLYFATLSTVFRVPVTGGTVTTFSSGWRGIHSLAVDASSLFLAELEDGAVVKLAKEP